MGSKEKARELVEEFSQYSDYENGKFCALICVDEIIESLYKLPSFADIVDARQAGGYWEEIKKEIKKL